MSKSNDVCIVIPTHNRPDYVRKSMEYYSSQFNIPVFYLDSSMDKLDPEEKISPNINYIHCPEKGFIEKLHEGIKLVNCNYVMLCPDDDFAFEKSIKRAVQYMADNRVPMVSGRIMGFKEGKLNDINDLNCLDAGVKFSENLYTDEKFFGNFHQILWSVYNVETLSNIINSLLEMKLGNDNFLELIFATQGICDGGIFLIDQPWLLREVANNNHWGLRHKPLTHLSSRERQDDIYNVSSQFPDGMFLKSYNAYIVEQKRREKIYNRIFRKLYRSMNNKYLRDEFRSIGVFESLKKAVNK